MLLKALTSIQVSMFMILIYHLNIGLFRSTLYLYQFLYLEIQKHISAALFFFLFFISTLKSVDYTFQSVVLNTSK